MKGGDRTLFQPSTERDQFEKLKRKKNKKKIISSLLK
jgi:hypothetical protein